MPLRFALKDGTVRQHWLGRVAPRPDERTTRVVKDEKDWVLYLALDGAV